MKNLLIFVVLAACCPLASGAAWWAENDYSTGSNGFKKDSLTVFTHVSRNVMAGGAASFYRDTALYRDKVYAFRFPVMYSGRRHFLSLTPFVYPFSPQARSGARGARFYAQTSVTEPDDEDYLHVTAAAAWAGQKAALSGFQDRKNFSETAVELQAEKSYYGQFFLLASAAAFSKTGDASNSNLVTPVLDHSEMAYLGTFRQVTALPDWVLTAQVSRSMKPEYASHLYLGYSKISFRQAPGAKSLILGIKLDVSVKTTLDVAYNAFKAEDSANKNYYKILLRTVF
ncbi:MAG: hypothetical protein A2234_08550 [Elusimicrobia bacterium RIFOXYA2_FULL_58_8]|nr:MAG: hypothetical protein A2234_08550 [Elusimicrobia bacterium RIFOXYA2_FULL_58_8]OGS14271.1 MAG: hypothetical protein A2285_05010 [Elusimicrobia bacterium RIFOXYA12_FULL_57_11]